MVCIAGDIEYECIATTLFPLSCHTMFLWPTLCIIAIGLYSLFITYCKLMSYGHHHKHVWWTIMFYVLSSLCTLALHWICCMIFASPGMKVYVTEEQELIMEPSLKWAANPNVTVVVKAYGLKATVQVFFFVMGWSSNWCSHYVIWYRIELIKLFIVHVKQNFRLWICKSLLHLVLLWSHWSLHFLASQKSLFLSWRRSDIWSLVCLLPCWQPSY